jgi:hypothetical protein
MQDPERVVHAPVPIAGRMLMGGQRRELFVTRKNHVASAFVKKLYARALRWSFICCIVTDVGSFMWS